MKKLASVMVVVLALVAMLTVLVSPCISAEVIKPTKSNTGSVGTTSRVWGYGYFGILPGFRVEVASKDWATATGDWELSTTEQRARIVYCYNTGGTGSTITAPSEVGRIYTVYNNSGYAVTIKKSGGSGVSINNGVAATVVYFQTNGSTDYHLVASAAF